MAKSSLGATSLPRLPQCDYPSPSHRVFRPYDSTMIRPSVPLCRKSGGGHTVGWSSIPFPPYQQRPSDPSLDIDQHISSHQPLTGATSPCSCELAGMRACAWVGMQGYRLAKTSYPHTPLNTTDIDDFKPNHTLFSDLSPKHHTIIPPCKVPIYDLAYLPRHTCAFQLPALLGTP